LNKRMIRERAEMGLEPFNKVITVYSGESYYHPEEGGYYQEGSFVDGTFEFNEDTVEDTFEELFLRLVADFASAWYMSKHYHPYTVVTFDSKHIDLVTDEIEGRALFRGEHIGDFLEIVIEDKDTAGNEARGYIPYE